MNNEQPNPGRVTAYTDGACRGNQHDNAPGGYGVVLLNGRSRKELAQGYADTTNNRMELRAAIAALKALKRPCVVDLYTDSKYVCDAFNQNWIEGWIDRGWKNASKKPVKNQDLWEELLPLVERHDVTFRWVKGHSDNRENNRADALATAAADFTFAHLADDGPTVVTVSRPAR